MERGVGRFAAGSDISRVAPATPVCSPVVLAAGTSPPRAPRDSSALSAEPNQAPKSRSKSSLNIAVKSSISVGWFWGCVRRGSSSGGGT